MPALRHTLTPLCAAIAAACVSYEPDPVDLQQHATAYTSRLLDLEAVRAFASEHGSKVEGTALTRREARLFALWLHPELRRMRAEQGVAAAVSDHSGLWPDPTIQGSVANKLGQTHPWLVTSAVGLTVPLSRQFAAQRELAERKHDTATLRTIAREMEVCDQLDVAWVRWSAAVQLAQALNELCAMLKHLDETSARLLAAGQITRPQARVFALEAASRKAELASAENAIAQARSELQQSLGMPPQSSVPLQEELQIESRAQHAGGTQADWSATPRIALLAKAHAEAEKQLELAVSKQWPSLSLFPGFEEEDAINRPAFAFSLPIPLWNRNQLAIAEAAAERDAARIALEAELEETAQARERARSARDAASRRLDIVRTELLPACRDQWNDATRQVELGDLDVLLLLDAATRVYEARRDELLAAVAEADAIANENGFYWPQNLPVAPSAESMTDQATDALRPTADSDSTHQDTAK